MLGTEVKQVAVTGSTDEEKDLSCCQQCSNEPDCEFWVRDTESDSCWLRRDFTQYRDQVTNRRGGFNPQHTLSCSADYYDMSGTAVRETVAHGVDDSEKDASCCAQCTQEPDCEFWVRATDSDSCWLKRGFLGFENTVASRRGGFKVGAPACINTKFDGRKVEVLFEIDSAEDCQDACQDVEKCSYWSLDSVEETCTMLSSSRGIDDTTVADARYTSGARDCEIPSPVFFDSNDDLGELVNDSPPIGELVHDFQELADEGQFENRRRKAIIVGRGLAQRLDPSARVENEDRQ